MEYRLMHKDIPVVELTLDEATCAIVRIGNLCEPAHLPVSIPVQKGEVDRSALNEWWKNCAIPANRQGIRDALRELKLPSTQNLLDKSFGLSLSDHYWIYPSRGAALTWKKSISLRIPFPMMWEISFLAKLHPAEKPI